MGMINILIGSTNPKKKVEITNITKDPNIQFTLLNKLENASEVPEVIEDGKTFKDNAIKKAITFAKWSGSLTLADDSGLEVKALNNRPGVYSARYAGEGATDAMRIRKILTEMSSISTDNRKARFKCAIALANPEKLLFVVEAKCDGIITTEPRGKNGFGYDPIFSFPEYDKTFAELSPETKNMISHRAKALLLFKERLKCLLKSFEQLQ